MASFIVALLPAPTIQAINSALRGVITMSVYEPFCAFTNISRIERPVSSIPWNKECSPYFVERYSTILLYIRQLGGNLGFCIEGGNGSGAMGAPDTLSSANTLVDNNVSPMITVFMLAPMRRYVDLRSFLPLRP